MDSPSRLAMPRVPPSRPKVPAQPPQRLRWSGPLQEEALIRALLRIMNHVRRRRRISLHAVERLTGIQRDRLRRMERLEIKRLSLRTLIQWCNGLNIDLDALIDVAREVMRVTPSR